MKNIFIASKGKGNYKEKIFSWILAFSLVVQNAAILPQMAYASESKDDSTTTAVIGESSTQESEDTSSDTHGDDNSSVDNLSRDDRNENNSDDADEDSKGQNEEGVDSDDDSDNKGHDAENVETLTTLFFALGGTSHGDDVHDNNVSSDDDSGNKGHGDDADDNNDSSDDDSDNKGHVDGDHVETLTTLVVALGGTGAHHDDDNDDDDVCDDDSDDHDSLDGNHDDDMDHNDDHSDSHHHNHGTSTSDDHESQDDHDDNSTNDHDDADGTPCVPPVVPPTTDLSVCPFEASATNYVISYGTGKKLVSNSTHADANVVKSTNIPAGTYEVSLHSYDSYDARTSVLQKNEQWYLRFNNLTTLIGISPSIGDLADNMKTATRTQYVGDVTVGQTITSAMAKHTAWSNTESNNDVYPICAQLKLKQVGQPQNTKPVITVVGANPRTVTVGSVYVDQSATVADQEDGNITNKLVTINTVNTSVVGTYTITYNATDTQNLSADAKTRTVNVVAPLACAAPLDVMIVLDRSGSMNDDGTNPEQPLTQAKQGANVFIDTLSPATDRVGVVTYSQFATLDSSLSSNFGSVKSTYASVSANGTTNIAAAIDEASSQIGTNGRSGAKHVIVLLSDGVPNVTGISLASATAQTIASAVTAKSNGTIIYTIGLGSDVNPALMQQIASAPSNYFFAPSGAQLEGVYKAISTIECQRVPATVSGMKVNDTNANGTKDAGELGIAGWQITLQEVGSTVIVTKTTGADGSYTFPDVTSGNYKLCEVAKNGWNQTFPGAGGCYTLNIDSGAVITGKNFLNTESDKPQCRDGKDNDGDLKADFPADLGCSSTEDNDENQKPVITVNAPNPMIVTLGTPFVDTGATALDPEDGNITANIVKAESVNTLVVGTYFVSYGVIDSKGLSADTKTREVKVVTACADGKDNDNDGVKDFPLDLGCANPEDNDENNRPVITVVGANPLDLTIGAVFTDFGATAADAEDGILTSSIVKTGTVNTAVIASYTIFYNVSDSKGLAAVEKSRIVRVNPVVTQCADNIDNDGDGKKDFGVGAGNDSGCDSPEDNDENNRPVITVLGTSTLVVSIGTLYSDLGATVFDAEDGQINNKLVATGTVNTAVLGTYVITYNATDSKALPALEKSRTVKVTSSCSDGKDNDNDGTIDFPTDLGCSTPEDDTENDKPVITVLGDVVMSIVVGTPFTDPLATVFDKEDGQINNKLVATGTVNTSVVGTYVITYNATDSQSIAADPKTRTVNIVNGGCVSNCGGGGGSTPPACSDGSDNDGDALADFPRDPGCASPQDNDERDTGPIITLLGANPVTITVGTTFTDPGATARDPEDGDITSRIVVTGTVGTSTVGAYTLTYNVSDTQGHPATPVTRMVNVVTAGCTANCGGGGGGGGSPTLTISNEALTVTGTTTVVITWNTNVPATSRVVYGLDSRPVSSVAPLYGYAISNATNTALVTAHSMTIFGIPSGIGTYFRPVSTDGVRTVVGVELARQPVGGVPQECFYLREYMRLGANNNPVEVTKLQTFLRNYEGFTTLAVTGFFDITTDVAVRAFQDKYATDVLVPWNLPGNTGYVYYTTQKKVNEIYCRRAFPLNASQLVEVAAFRDLIDRINAQGGVAPELPLVGTNASGGSVAGASTVAKAPVSGTPDEVSLSEKRGRIALADLLATVPHVGSELSAGDNSETDINQGRVVSDYEVGAVAGTSTKRGLAAVMASISDKTNFSEATIYFIALFIILSLIFSVIYFRTRPEEEAI